MIASALCREEVTLLSISRKEVISVSDEKITVQKAAAVMQKSQQFVRIGLQHGNLPFGTAVKANKRWNYYISPKLFYEYVGGGPCLESTSPGTGLAG